MTLIISRTPLRISLFGGGTDFPAFFREHGGLCIAAAINKYVYVVVKRRDDGKLRLSYTQTEIVSDASELQHDLIRGVFQALGRPQATNLEIATLADVPGHGSGLASSSAVTVGALNALAHDKWLSLDQLAQKTIEVETEIVGNTPGWQDQIMVSRGGFGVIAFGEASPTIGRIGQDDACNLRDKLLLFRICSTQGRDSRQILSEQNERVEKNAGKLLEIKRIAERALDILATGDFDSIGPLLHESWTIKSQLAGGISTWETREAYYVGCAAGATGGKLCGAGGGGHMLFFCPTEEARRNVRGAMGELRHKELPFEFEFGGAICKRLF